MRFKKNVGAVLQKSGVSFRVWAPFATSVAVTGTFNGWSDTPLTSEKDGYWYVFVRGAVAGQEYKFVITNGNDKFYRNDPRAMHFTTSAGTSVITGTSFDWGETDFVPPLAEQQVIYELHVGTFNRPDAATTGTFADVVAKLDHLAGLGINMIELMPIGSMMMDRGWGYAIDYIFAVESLYGGRRGFLEFVKAAHQRGIGVILDVVYNHFGPDSSLDLWRFDGWYKDDKGGIYFYNDYRAETPWGNTRPDFGRREVMQYILDNVKMWAQDCRVDGLRVDSTIFMRNVKGYNNDPSNDLPEGWQLLQQINTISKKINSSIITIAEDVAANEYIVKPTDAGGAGFDAQWELNFHESLKDALADKTAVNVNLAGFCAQLSKLYSDNPFQKVIFMDSHDSAANNSCRWNERIAPGQADGLFARRQSLIAAALLFCSPGIPMLFQGQEFMEPGSFNDWRGLDWSRAERHAGIVQAYQHLIALRKNATDISAGLAGKGVNLVQLDEDNKVIAFHRWNKGGPKDDVMVVANLGKKLHPVYDLSFPRNGNWKVRFNSTWKGYSPDFKQVDVPDVSVENGGGSLVLPPNCALILSQDD